MSETTTAYFSVHDGTGYITSVTVDGGIQFGLSPSIFNAMRFENEAAAHTLADRLSHDYGGFSVATWHLNLKLTPTKGGVPVGDGDQSVGVEDRRTAAEKKKAEAKEKREARKAEKAEKAKEAASDGDGKTALTKKDVIAALKTYVEDSDDEKKAKKKIDKALKKYDAKKVKDLDENDYPNVLLALGISSNDDDDNSKVALTKSDVTTAIKNYIKESDDKKKARVEAKKVLKKYDAEKVSELDEDDYANVLIALGIG